MAGTIQDSINNALGVAGVLTGLTGIPQERREAARLDKIRKSARSQRDAIVGTLEDAPSDSPEYAGAKETTQYFDEKLGEATRAKFEVRPTAENANEILKENIKAQRNKAIIGQAEQRKVEREGMEKEEADAQAAYQEEMNQRMEQGYVPDDEVRAQQAMGRMGKQQKAKKALRRNFMTYLAQQPTSLGGTVGDLSPELQKKIATQYDRNDRRRMMNQMDKEAKNGKQ